MRLAIGESHERAEAAAGDSHPDPGPVPTCSDVLALILSRPVTGALIEDGVIRLRPLDVADAASHLAGCDQVIIDRLGGRLWVKSTPGTGATFSFTLREAAPVALPATAEGET